VTWTDPANEYEALVYVARRLSERYGIDQDDVIVLIAEELESFGGVRLRAYIPTLIEHRVRERLLAGLRSLPRAG
jgi:hypothetical protein